MKHFMFFRNKLSSADDIKELEGCNAVSSLGRLYVKRFAYL